MHQSNFADSGWLKIFLFLFFLFVCNLTVSAQNGLIKAMPFEFAEEIAIQSIRRASGIRVKKIDFKHITQNDQLIALVKKDKYLRNCLDKDKLDCIHKHGGICPDKNCPNDICPNGSAPKKKPINYAVLETELNEKCFPFKRLRLTDTLDFLGITDEFRLAALRRYIVRSSEFGVINIWGISRNGVAQPFILSGKQLEGIKTSTTVLDLAKTIQTSASLPFLSEGTAETIIRACRNKVTGFIDKPQIENLKIQVDLMKSNVDKPVKKFVDCITFSELGKDDKVTFKDELAKSPENFKNFKYGVESIKIIDNRGNDLFYYLTKEFTEWFKFDSTSNGLTDPTITYKQLLEKIVASASVPSPREFMATRIVINSLLQIAEERRQNKTKLLYQPRELFKVSDVLCQLRKDGCDSKKRVTVASDLESIDVSPDDVKSRIEAESANQYSAYLILDKNKRFVKIVPITLTGKITSATTIEELILIVSRNIKIT